MLGKIETIEVVRDFGLANMTPVEGSKGARIGLGSMIGELCGRRTMGGYKVKTSKHELLVLIDNEQSCCENWGYFSSDDNLQDYVGATLQAVELVDTALNVKDLEERFTYGFYEGGVQFVTFKTDRGDFQLAVYNAHNGYYGHGIIIAEDGHILCQDTL